MSSNRIYGSLCLTDILEAAKKGHSAFKRGKDNKKVYVNVTIWENEEPDQFDNDYAVQLSSTKEARESGKEKKATYIGNLRKPRNSANQEKEDIREDDKEISSAANALDDLPF